MKTKKKWISESLRLPLKRLRKKVDAIKL
jgi:hypothetical protein